MLTSLDPGSVFDGLLQYCFDFKGKERKSQQVQFVYTVVHIYFQHLDNFFSDLHSFKSTLGQVTVTCLMNLTAEQPNKSILRFFTESL